jgi:hypothetical protein
VRQWKISGAQLEITDLARLQRFVNQLLPSDGMERYDMFFMQIISRVRLQNQKFLVSFKFGPVWLYMLLENGKK